MTKNESHNKRKLTGLHGSGGGSCARLFKRNFDDEKSTLHLSGDFQPYSILSKTKRFIGKNQIQI